MSSAPVAILNFAIHQADGKFSIQVSEVGSDRLTRARAVLTADEKAEAEAHVRAAAMLLANYAIRTLTPDYADQLTPIGHIP